MTAFRTILAATLLFICTVSVQVLPLQAEDNESKESEKASEASIDQDTLEILKEMSDALASLKEFSFDAQISTDETLNNGQTYFLFAGAYYQPFYSGNSVVHKIVPAPA